MSMLCVGFNVVIQPGEGGGGEISAIVEWQRYHYLFQNSFGEHKS